MTARLLPWLCLAVAALFGLAIALRLRSHDVPLSLTLACALAVAHVVDRTAERVIGGRAWTTYRCPAPGCLFEVRVRGVDAGESRHWQETAANHPTH
ncbi:hypothetical protein [Streptomyces sp. NPDC093225]|uniref:hypothetical protein n=1 Tax=Streptomyces sp. NPDC093225 TaxID=3366034 RepID=UPI0037F847F7